MLRRSSITPFLLLLLGACERAPAEDPSGGAEPARGISPQPVPIPGSKPLIDVAAIEARADGDATRVVGGPNAVTPNARIFAWDVDARTSAEATVGGDGAFTLALGGAPTHAFRLVALVESFTTVADVVVDARGHAVPRTFEACVRGGNSDVPNVFAADAPVGGAKEVSTTFTNTCERDVTASLAWVSGPAFASRGDTSLAIPKGEARPVTLVLAPRARGFAIELLLVRVNDVAVPVTLIALGLDG